jgi:CheY-like chemotaxis protein
MEIMAGFRSILCIHRDPAQLSVLQKKGYEVTTATHGSQGLHLLMSQSVDVFILEYYLGLLDGADVADEIKKVRPWLPIVMLAECLELPEGPLKSVDALVTVPTVLTSCWRPFTLCCKQRIVCTSTQLLQSKRRREEKRPCRVLQNA